MKKRITLDAVLLVITAVVWVPALIIGIFAALVVVGFCHGYCLVTGKELRYSSTMTKE